MLKQQFSSTPAHELLSQANTFAVMPFVAQCEPFGPGMIATGLEEANGSTMSEVWTVSEPVSRGLTGRCFWSKTDDVMCVAHWLSKDECEAIEPHTQGAYTAVLSLLAEHGYAYPFRFWNYLPDINVGEGDNELYKKFCTGRLNAFESAGITPDGFPAASALGHHSEGAVIYVFASKVKPEHYKNNHQVNAYEYPRQYGVSSPSFARATALTINGADLLFISGTASIIGHQTLGEGDIERQLDVTMSNIGHLLESANPKGCKLAAFKVYVRHPEHVAFTRQWLSERYPDVNAVYTLADVCRKELLVEIECFCA
ncbi:hypothetical protein [Aestuariibacter sp. A3R04]|uniref:chorismate transformation enzyme, FkbO/Hyg5 family n=1 Tax=Aestuariibacter sp. A3R04 TaxID=2841571 RepID=UPI001C099099|nr:hypothetical protein [Aestuariibacter sp. A3R04]MBU3020483.1 hypothetical protein [Aestuariibacter sp. A3R04]